MVRTLPAVLLGAGGATAAVEYGADISGYVREVTRAITHHSTRPNASGSGGDNTALAGEIDSLKRLMLESNRGQVVVVDKGRSVGWGMLPYVIVGLGLGYAYIRFVKGWKLSDLMYVSQASLKASSNALKQGIDGLKDYTSKTKEYLTSRLNVLEDDQKAHMDKTERIDDRLINLGDTVDDMHTELSEVNNNVQHVKGTLGEIQDAQKYNSQGIFLLLKVVGELVYHNDFKIRSRSELEQFSRATPPMVEGGHAPGLESLLAFSTADKGGMAELEAPSDFSDSSSRIQEIDGISQLHRSVSGDADRNKLNPRTAPRVFTRDSGPRRMMHSNSDGFGLGSLKRRD